MTDFSTFDAAILAGRPMRPEEYAQQDNPFRWELWKQVVSAHAVPAIYPGSIAKPCHECGIDVQVGPRQQEMLNRTDTKVIVLCHVDAAIAVQTAQAQGGSASMHDLGNPYRPKEATS